MTGAEFRHQVAQAILQDLTEASLQASLQDLDEASLQAPQPDRQGKGEQRIAAKVAILRAWTVYWHQAAAGAPQRRTMEAFVWAYHQGQIAIRAEIRQARPRLSRASLQRWQRQLRQEGPGRLAGYYGPGPLANVWARHPDLTRAAIEIITEDPMTKGVRLHGALKTRFPGMAPGRRTVYRFLATVRARHHPSLTALAVNDARDRIGLPPTLRPLAMPKE